MIKNSSIILASVFVTIKTSVYGGLFIPTTEIGNPNNSPHFPTGMGHVPYTYYLSDEITNAQFSEYWKATHNGEEYVFWYADEGVTASDPAGVSSPIDAIRFANWLHNGQGDADTESGAYTITTFPRHEDSPILNGYWIAERNEDAEWFIPSLDEWVKAFYLESNSLEQNGAYPSSYGWTGGEWTETIVTGQLYDWDPVEYEYYFSTHLSPSLTSTDDIQFEYPLTPYLSFRVGTTIPEPSSAILILVGGAVFFLKRNQLKNHDEANQCVHSLAGSARSE